ncbi:hypothetical protein M885DRAFT_624049 [Pelagophyceae sp. CCMP2097]|nr:hypothetical protein M885DRAFT_624049 [Pelagophyceae sp. CCMP2097]
MWHYAGGPEYGGAEYGVPGAPPPPEPASGAPFSRRPAPPGAPHAYHASFAPPPQGHSWDVALQQRQALQRRALQQRALRQQALRQQQQQQLMQQLQELQEAQQHAAAQQQWAHQYLAAGTPTPALPVGAPAPLLQAAYAASYAAEAAYAAQLQRQYAAQYAAQRALQEDEVFRRQHAVLHAARAAAPREEAPQQISPAPRGAPHEDRDGDDGGSFYGGDGGDDGGGGDDDGGSGDNSDDSGDRTETDDEMAAGYAEPLEPRPTRVTVRIRFDNAAAGAWPLLDALVHSAAAAADDASIADDAAAPAGATGAQPRGLRRANLANLDAPARAAACMEALEDYVCCCGGNAGFLQHWTATVEQRREGSTAGTFDVYYHDAYGRKFCSRAEVARALQLAVPAGRGGAARAPDAAAGFGRTKKARMRVAHARRFLQVAAPARASLWRTLRGDGAPERARAACGAMAGAAAGDDVSAAGASCLALTAVAKLDRLRVKLEEARGREAAAAQSLAAAEALSVEVESRPDGEAAGASKDVDRERRALDRLRHAVGKLVEVVADAEGVAQKRLAQDADRHRKKQAKEAVLASKRLERSQDCETRKSRREGDALAWKRERGTEAAQRRAGKDADAAAAAAHKVSAEAARRDAARYPVDDSLLHLEPPRCPPLPAAPAPRPAGALLGLPADVVGEVLAAHALLGEVHATRGRAPPPLDAFCAALASQAAGYAGRSGAANALRHAHALLLEPLLGDDGAEAWWPAAGTFGEDADGAVDARGEDAWVRLARHFDRRCDDRQEAGVFKNRPLPRSPASAVNGRASAKKGSKRALASMMSESSKRQRLSNSAAVADGAEPRLKGPAPATDETPGEAVVTVTPAEDAAPPPSEDDIVYALSRGEETDATTRRWVAAVEQCASAHAWSAVRDALACAARYTTLDEARRFFEARALECSPASARALRGRGLALARRARLTRPRAWAGVAADRDAARGRAFEAAAAAWRANAGPPRAPEPGDAAAPPGRATIAAAGPAELALPDLDEEDEDDDGDGGGATAGTLWDAAGWRVSASAYLGRRVRRAVVDEASGVAARCEGVVVGWLGTDESEYADCAGAAAALWRVRFDAGGPAGAEDLEEHEVRASLVDAPVSGAGEPHDAKPPRSAKKGAACSGASVFGTNRAEKRAAARRRARDASDGGGEALHAAITAEARWLRLERRGSARGARPAADAAPSALPRPPGGAVGARTWAALAGAVCLRLLRRDRALRGAAAESAPERAAAEAALERAAAWLAEGAPYSGLGPRERIAVLKALCDAYAGSGACAVLVERAADARTKRDAFYDVEDRERKRRAADRDRATSDTARERLGVPAGAPCGGGRASPSPARGADPVASPADGPAATAVGGAPPRKRPRVGAAPPPLSAALDRLLVLDAPVTLAAQNPKLAGSHCHALYDRYRDATTLSEVFRLGGRRSDVYNDLARGYCKFTASEHQAVYDAAVRDSLPPGNAAAAHPAEATPTTPVSARPVKHEPLPPIPNPNFENAEAAPRGPQPTRHRFRAEVAHVRLVEACGGGAVAFVEGLAALERREAAAGHEARSDALRGPRERALAALKRATGAGDAGALRAAVANAKRDDVLLEGLDDGDDGGSESDAADDDDTDDGDEGSDAGARDTKPAASKAPKRWVLRELGEAYEALRDADARAARELARRLRFADRRAQTFPRLEVLGIDRDGCKYWTLPADGGKAARVWRTAVPAGREEPPWAVYVGDAAVRALAAALDDRGIRERDLKAAILDSLPPA